jgi:hypothetical protein
MAVPTTKPTPENNPKMPVPIPPVPGPREVNAIQRTNGTWKMPRAPRSPSETARARKQVRYADGGVDEDDNDSKRENRPNISDSKGEHAPHALGQQHPEGEDRDGDAILDHR